MAAAITEGKFHEGDAYQALNCDDIFDLHNFYGLWDAHNHTRSSVHFLGRNDEFLARYASGRVDNVNWTPVHAVATCSG
ncbi:MAG: hypothetical protein GEV11_09060 [Streptosporangiales bacterium]|nr:hypothetical protein [Streptosporangiales bacterium]